MPLRSLSLFLSLSFDLLLRLPRDITFPRSLGRREEQVCWSTRARARARARSPRLSTGPVSLDECGSSHAYNRETWTEFKPIQGRWTGVSDDPTLLNFLLRAEDALFSGTDPRGNFLVLVR